MVKIVIVFLLLVACSFALIDPPVDSVYSHNLGIAAMTTDTLHYNALGVPPRTPTLDNPTSFSYIRALTLTPSVNHSISSSRQPQLVWLTAEAHDHEVTEDHDNGNCSRVFIRRTFYPEIEVQNITAYYTIDGLIKNDAGTTTYNTANRTIELRTPIIGSFINPSPVPFERTLGCSISDFFAKNLLGSLINLSCYDESLYRASPYSNSVVNFTQRNVTVIRPHLNVTVRWTYAIEYAEQEKIWHRLPDGSCEEEDPPLNYGNVTITNTDTDSYEVQNDRFALIPISPGFLSLDANTSENVVYQIGVLSTADVYKYYVKMDNKTAGACYLYNFSVVNDAYGIQTITATPFNHTGVLPEDPESVNNYTGSHEMPTCNLGASMLDASPITNQSYNYSREYYFLDYFYNMSQGNHSAELQFHTWLGNASAYSNITVKWQAALSMSAYQLPGQIVVNCWLRSNGLPLSGELVKLTVQNETRYTRTNALGFCSETFTVVKVGAGILGEYAGSDRYTSSNSFAVVLGLPVVGPEGNLLGGNLALMFILVGLLGFALLRLSGYVVDMMRGEHGPSTMGGAFDKFFPKKKQTNKGAIEAEVKRQQKKEMMKKAALVVATGGAAAAAGGAAGASGATGSGASATGVSSGSGAMAKNTTSSEVGKSSLSNMEKAQIQDLQKKDQVEVKEPKDVPEQTKKADEKPGYKYVKRSDHSHDGHKHILAFMLSSWKWVRRDRRKKYKSEEEKK